VFDGGLTLNHDLTVLATPMRPSGRRPCGLLELQRSSALVARLQFRFVAILELRLEGCGRGIRIPWDMGTTVSLLGVAGPTRLELATSGVTGRRSNQLNYDPAFTLCSLDAAELRKGPPHQGAKY
jgi:hypothetical protein